MCTRWTTAVTKERNKAICSNSGWLQQPRDYQTQWSKSDRERQVSFGIPYMRSLKYDTNELIYKAETDSHT